MAARRKLNNAVVPLLVAALVAIALLATLQYSWVGQISDGYRERMRSSLHTGIVHFSEEFDRELALAYLTFQIDPETLRARNWSRFAKRYDRWTTTASDPHLVKGVYLAQIYSRGRPSLLQFNPEQRRFEPVKWPETLLPMRDQLMRATEDAASGVQGEPLPAIFEQPLALLVPSSRVVRLSDERQVQVEASLIFGDDVISDLQRRCTQCRQTQRTPLSAFTIVALDQQHLTETFVPALAQRHFGSLDYTITIVARDDPTRVIYRSDPQGAEQPVADEAAGILDVRLDAFNSLLASSAFEDDAPVNQGEQLSERLLIGVYGRDAGREDAVAAQEHGRWKLILTHREGSLEAAVGALRSRNLAISFGILLLLVGSIAMIAVATRRAQWLARQQISFVAAVSHELRTPLAVICSAGENLADGVVREPQQTRQYGAVIHSEGRRLAEMVEQVLEFAGAQSQQRRYTLAHVDVRAAIERALVCCCPPHERERYTFVLDVPDDLPPVFADESALLRALQNLIDNAMKYGGDACRIEIGAHVTSGPHGNQVAITVRDHGMGIQPGDLPHIFEPFFRGGDVAAAQIRGSGLGLSLVEHIARAMDGTLSVESAPGRGSSFTLRLPCPSSAAEAGEHTELPTEETLRSLHPLP